MLELEKKVEAKKVLDLQEIEQVLQLTNSLLNWKKNRIMSDQLSENVVVSHQEKL